MSKSTLYSDLHIGGRTTWHNPSLMMSFERLSRGQVGDVNAPGKRADTGDAAQQILSGAGEVRRAQGGGKPITGTPPARPR